MRKYYFSSLDFKNLEQQIREVVDARLRGSNCRLSTDDGVFTDGFCVEMTSRSAERVRRSPEHFFPLNDLVTTTDDGKFCSDREKVNQIVCRFAAMNG